MIARLRKSNVPEFPRGPDGNNNRIHYLISSDEFHPNREYNLILS